MQDVFLCSWTRPNLSKAALTRAGRWGGGFVFSSKTMGEVVELASDSDAGLQIQFAGDTTRGQPRRVLLMVLQYRRANQSVLSISVTTRNEEVSISNLSSPITMKLPIPHESEYETAVRSSGVCASAGPVSIYCDSTGSKCNVSFEGAGQRWNVSCPHWHRFPLCLCWNDEGMGRSSDSEIICVSTHLSNFLGVVGRSLMSVAKVMSAYETTEPQDLRRVFVLIAFLVVCNIFAIAVLLRDVKRMRVINSLQGQEMWESAAFQMPINSLIARVTQQP